MACGGFICSKNSLCALNLLYMILEIGWNKSKAMQTGLEETLNCCDFAQVNYNRTCEAVCFRSQQCEPCSVKLQAHVEDALNVVGGVSLFFSFTEILGVWLSYRYRNQKDPRSNPGAFI
uniref:Tetraspanin 31 n=1 Tax=Electrophorus electricus TaxID=8005 RepID=A0A4W4E917_ELEEL